MINCDVTKVSNVILDTLVRKSDSDHVVMNIQMLTKMIFYKEKLFVQNKNFNKSMNYITDTFHKHRNSNAIKAAIGDYFKALRAHFDE